MPVEAALDALAQPCSPLSAGIHQTLTNGRAEVANSLLQAARARGYGTPRHSITIAYLVAGKLTHLPASPFNRVAYASAGSSFRWCQTYYPCKTEERLVLHARSVRARYFIDLRDGRLIRKCPSIFLGDQDCAEYSLTNFVSDIGSARAQVA